MTCGSCPFAVCMVLERVAVVTKADVKYNEDYVLGAVVIFGSTNTRAEQLTNAVFWTLVSVSTTMPPISAALRKSAYVALRASFREFQL